MNDFVKKINIIIVAVLFIALGFIGAYIEKLDTEYVLAKKTNTEISDKIYDTITIHIKGAIVNSGVYNLNDNNRVIDAVNAAGGFLENADKDAVNLARVIHDGEEIFIPKQGEDFTITPSGKININKADIRLLKTIPNIDEKMSGKIIEYRETYGDFKKVSDIKRVKGIGDKTFAVIKDFICVE